MASHLVGKVRARTKALMVFVAVGLVISVAQSQMQARRTGRSSWFRGPTICEAAAKLRLPQNKQRQISWIVEAAQAEQDQQRARAGLNREVTEQAMEQIRQMLHPEEYSQFEEQMGKPARAETVRQYFSSLRSLGLNVRQEAEIDKVVEETTERIKRILTADQREQLSAAMEHPVRGLSSEINRVRQRWESFSEEEREDLKRVGEEFRERFRNAQTPEERRQLMGEIRDKWREVFGSGDDTADE